MKSLLLSAIFSLLFVNVLHGQTTFTCTYREYCDWDNAAGKFVNCQGYEENSMFKMNKEESMFVHTTETIKSAYYVESKEYDKQNDVYKYNVTSDVGNKYLYIFDLKNKEIRVLINGTDKIQLLRFYVKSYWSE